MVFAFAGQHDSFDRQQFAADFRPRETGDLADLIFLLRNAEGVTPHAQDTCRDSSTANRRSSAVPLFQQQLFTTLRQIFEISRSSARTPASRV